MQNRIYALLELMNDWRKTGYTVFQTLQFRYGSDGC